jgi:hypothetical protein
MENKKENTIIFQPKKSKAKNCFGPMTFKLLTKNKNFNLMKFFQESKEKIKSHNTSRNKEINKMGGIKNIKDFLLHNSKKNKKQNSHSSNNSKLKGERNLKKTLIMPYQTFNKTSINQWKAKYHTKNNSSKIYYTNPEISKNMSIPSPHIRQYSKEYNIINSKQKSIIDKSIKKKKINLMSNLQIYINKNENTINNKEIDYKNIINGKNKENDIYYKLENIKARCHNLLKNFSIHTIYLKNEIDKYKNKNYNISLKHNMVYSVSNTEI